VALKTVGIDKIIISLISVIFGFSLYFLKDYFTKRSERKKVINALKIESKHNLNLMNRFWEEVNYEPPKDDGKTIFDVYLKTFCRSHENMVDIKQEFGKNTLFYRILSSQKPRFNFRVWDKHAEIAAVNLETKKFGLLYEFYENLIEINILYSYLRDIYINESKKGIDRNNQDEYIDRIKQHSKKWISLENLIIENKKLYKEIFVG
jgi:hypothetical protein